MQPQMQGEKVEIFDHQLINSTTIESVWNSPKRQQYQIEAGLVASFIIMFIQLILGSFRRKSNNGFFKFLLWLANSSSYFLVASTMGMMISFPFDNKTFDKELLAIWALSLYMTLGSTDTLSAYSLEDNETWKKEYFQQILQSLYVTFLIFYVDRWKFTLFMCIMYLIVYYRLLQRILSFRMAGRSFDLQKNTKVIADHMKEMHEENKRNQLVTDPTCMDGYHYLVTGEEELEPEPGSYTIDIDVEAVEIITVDKIWKCKGTLLNPERDPDGKLKDVCLSFALFKMLRRRFSGHPFAESQDQQTKDFVSKGLISEQGDYERAFWVIEVELSFLYDYFFTRYPVIYSTEKLTLLTSLLIIVANGLLGWKVIIKGIYLETIITLLFVALVIIFEFSQIVIYLNSDWAKISLISQYVAKSRWQGNPRIEGALRILCRVPTGKRWQNRLGQYSLLQSFRYKPKGTAITNIFTCGLVDKKRKGQKEIRSVDIPASVKGEIISALKLTDGYEQMKNGIASLIKNGVSTKLSWACSLQSDTQTILVWHVATSLCEMHKKDQQYSFDHFNVAGCLSKYCGYLVAFAPELLPDSKYDSELIFDNAVKEAKGLLGRTRSMEEVYEKLIEAGDVSSSKTVLKGAGLAKELIGDLDEPMRWKVLAEFWAEMILYITPSDNATDHLKHLTQGGEFITHMWALLSHAGILDRPPKIDRVGSETL